MTQILDLVLQEFALGEFGLEMMLPSGFKNLSEVIQMLLGRL